MRSIFTVLCMVASLCAVTQGSAWAQSAKFPAPDGSEGRKVIQQFSASSRMASGMSAQAADYGDAPGLISLDGFGAEGSNYVVETAIDAQGNTYVLGDFAGTIEVDGTTLTTENYKAIFLAKYNTAGEQVWIKSMSSSLNGFASEAFGLDMELNSSGDIYFAGKYLGGDFSFGSANLPVKEGYAFFVAKADSEGNVSWARNYEAGFDPLREVQPLTCDDAHVYINKSESIQKIDASGTLVEEVFFEYGVYATQLSAYNNKLYMTGFFDRKQGISVDFAGVTLTSENVRHEILIAAFDANMQLEWVKKATHTEFDNSYGMRILANPKGIFFSGYVGGYMEFTEDSKIINEHGDFYAKADALGNINWLEMSQNGQVEDFDTHSSSLFLQCANVIVEADLSTGLASSQNDLEGVIDLNSFAVTDDQAVFGGSFENKIKLFSADTYSSPMTWEAQVAASYGEVGFVGLEKDAEGNIYQYGHFTGNVEVYGQPLSGAGGFVLKQDVAGNVLWIKVIQDAWVYPPSGRQMEVNSAGDIFITGYYQKISIGEHTLPEESVDHIFAARLSSEGEVIYLTKVQEGTDSHGIAADADGNAFVAADFVMGTFDMVPVYKLDPQGNIVWNVEFQSKYMAYPAVDSEGNLFLTGEHYNDHITYVSASGAETVIQLSLVHDITGLAKFDTSGELIWGKTLAANDESTEPETGGWPNAIEIDQEGNVLITMWIYENSKFGDILPPNSSDYYSGIFAQYSKGVVKCNTNGEVLWYASILEAQYSFNYSELALDSEGSVYISGQQVKDSILFVTSSYADEQISGFEFIPSNYNDGYVAKLTKDGEWEWVKTISSIGYSWSRGMEALAPDDVMVNGVTRGGGMKIEDQELSSTVNHGYVFRLLNCQEITAEISADNQEVCQGEESQLTSSEVTYATSYQWTVSPANAGTITGEGNAVTVLWDEAFEGEAMVNLTITNECDESQVIDPLAIQVNNCVLSAEDELTDRLSLYPNPAGDKTKLQLFLSNQTDVSVQLFDMSGREVYTLRKENQSGNFKADLNMSAFEKGVYILQITTEQGKVNKRLIKE